MADSRRGSSGPVLPYTIPNCVALQVISGAETPLSSGDLTLQLPTVTHPRATSDPTDSSTPLILLAFVGKTLFPLYSTTVFGTFASNPRQYAFDFQLTKDQSTQVRLVLPEDVESSEQDRFEEILIHRGLLLQGIRAAGDEIMRGAREGGAVNASRIQSATEDHVASTASAGNDPLSFSGGSHEGLARVNDASTNVYKYAANASNAVASAAGGAGSTIRRGIDNMSSRDGQPDGGKEGGADEMGDMRRALNDAAGGIADGASNVATTAQDSASTAVKHGYGDEAQEAAASAGDSMKQMGKATGNVVHSASLLGATEYAVAGAVQDDKAAEGRDGA